MRCYRKIRRMERMGLWEILTILLSGVKIINKQSRMHEESSRVPSIGKLARSAASNRKVCTSEFARRAIGTDINIIRDASRR